MRQSNVATHLVVLNYLEEIAQANALSANLREQAGRGFVKIKDAELFVRKSIGGAAGIYELLNDTTDKADGVCNVNKGVLPSNQAFVIEEISIAGALGDDITSAGSVDYGFAVDNAVKNAELVITQNGREVVNMPAVKFINDLAVPSQEVSIKLKSFAYLNDNEYFSVAIKFPQGATVAAGTAAGTFAYLELRLGGHKTEKKA